MNRNFCLEFWRVSRRCSNLCARQVGILHDYLCSDMCYSFRFSAAITMSEREVQTSFAQCIIDKYLQMKCTTGWNLTKKSRETCLMKIQMYDWHRKYVEGKIEIGNVIHVCRPWISLAKHWSCSRHSRECCLLLPAVELNKMCISSKTNWIFNQKSDFASWQCPSPYWLAKSCKKRFGSDM